MTKPNIAKSDSSEAQDTQKMEVTEGTIVDDTRKGFCFFCLRFYNYDRHTHDPSSVNTFLQTLSHYLKINLRNISEVHAKDANNYIDDLIISLCSECSSEGERFSTLYKEQEMIEMLIQSSLQGISNLVTRAMSDPGRMARAEEILQTVPVQDTDNTGLKDRQNKGISKAMRYELIRKCSDKLKTAMWPKVIVKRIEMQTKISNGPGKGDCQNNSSAIVKKEMEISDTESIEGSNFSDISFEDNGTSTEDDINTDDDSATEIDNDGEVINGKVQSSSKNRTLRRTSLCCEYCSRTLSTKISVVCHIVRSHADQLFYHYKTPSKLTDNEFKLAVQLVLKSMLDSARDGEVEKFKCELCSYVKPSKQISIFRMHLVNEHFAEVAERIENIQKESSLTEKIANMAKCPKKKYTKVKVPNSKPKNSGHYSCRACGHRYWLRESLVQHVKEKCPALCDVDDKDKDFRKYMIIPSKEELYHMCGSCGKTFTLLRNLDRHEKRRCKNRNVETSTRKPFTCEACGTFFAEKYSLDRHIKGRCLAKRNKLKQTRRYFGRKWNAVKPMKSASAIVSTVIKSEACDSKSLENHIQVKVEPVTMDVGGGAGIKVENMKMDSNSNENEAHFGNVHIETSPIYPFVFKRELTEEVNDNDDETKIEICDFQVQVNK